MNQQCLAPQCGVRPCSRTANVRGYSPRRMWGCLFVFLPVKGSIKPQNYPNELGEASGCDGRAWFVVEASPAYTQRLLWADLELRGLAQVTGSASRQRREGCVVGHSGWSSSHSHVSHVLIKKYLTP